MEQQAYLEMVDRIVADKKARGLKSNAQYAELVGMTTGRFYSIIKHGKMPRDDELERITLALQGAQSPPPVERTALVGVASEDGDVPPPPTAEQSDGPTSPVDDVTPIRGLPDTPRDLTFLDLDEVFDLDGDPLVLEADESGTYRVPNSEIQSFKDCRRRWWLAWYRNLRMKVQDPTGVRAIGDRIHRALKMYYVPDGETAVDPRDALEQVIRSDWNMLVRATSDAGLEAVPEDVQADFAKESDLERAMIEGYVQWITETGIDSDLKVIASETYVEATLETPVQHWGEPLGPTAIIGKLDTRATRTTDGAKVFVDHKSVGDLTQPVRILPLDEQMLHYHLIESLAAEDGERTAGALYNMLRRVKRTGKAKPPFYQRVGPVNHNDHELESYRIRVAGVIRDIESVRKALDAGADHRSVAYPRPTRDCPWKCEFFPICGMFDDGSRVDDAITQYYEVGDRLGYYRSNDDEATTESE